MTHATAWYPKRSIMSFPRDENACHFLDWDSEHFGFPIARLRGERLSQDLLSHADRWCRRQSIRCLYFLADPDDPNLLALARQFRFELVDVRMTLRANLSSCATPADSGIIPIRVASAAELPTLAKLASTVHGNTRFFRDTRFPKEKVNELYGKWIRRDVIAGNTLIALSGNPTTPTGYVTIHTDTGNHDAAIGLIGVAESARGKGLGRLLIDAAIVRSLNNGARELSVVTQGANTAAQRLYQAKGFRTVCCKYWYHRWFP